MLGGTGYGKGYRTVVLIDRSDFPFRARSGLENGDWRGSKDLVGLEYVEKNGHQCLT